jgi:hypothetical protein
MGKLPRAFVLMHELIDRYGLSNADLSDPLIQDIFFPLIHMDGGATRDKDGAKLAGSPAVFNPPFKLNAKNAGVIRRK